MKKNLTLFVAFWAFVSFMNAQIQLSTNELTGTYKYKTTTTNPFGIHDPSVYWNSADQTYYVYGSHYVGAKTTDLRNWTGIYNYYTGGYNSANAYKAFKSNPTHIVKRCLPGSTVQEEVTLESYDVSAFCSIYSTIHYDPVTKTYSDEPSWVSGDQWAPDIIYNPHMGKWCLYLSLNADNWASVIVLLTSNSPTGPFTYVAPIVFGGFNGQTYSGKNAQGQTVSFKVDYKKTDLELVLGTQTSLPSRYNQKGSWGNMWPNPIDPCVFFDEDGELWIAYGSWSGGIFMLKLDKETGLRDYTYTYPLIEYNGIDLRRQSYTGYTSDHYFGKLIAGGAYVSGEGPYIQHIGNYYYLFMSYGRFAPDGGYEMRIFRSSNPTGPFTDASNNDARTYSYVLNYGLNAATNKGMKIIGAYNGWGAQTLGECAHGHNSVCQDDMGRTLLVTHSKFNLPLLPDGSRNAAHAMRVHQLFLNEKDWLCAAPFVFNGETLTDDDIATSQPWSATDIEGDYEIIIHPYKLDHDNMQESTPVKIHLSADGKVTGAYTGTWKYSQDGKSYIQIKLGSTIYYGVVCEQTVQGTNTSIQTVTSNVKALCFSAVASSGVPVWGYKWQPQYAIAYNYDQHSSAELKRNTTVKNNITILFDPVHNTTLEWTSSNPDVLSETGKYNPTDEVEQVTMTSRLSAGNYYWENSYTANCAAATSIDGDPYDGVVAYYNFDEKPTKNLMNEEQRATYAHSSTSTPVPVLEGDYSRFGQVVHQYAGAIRYNSYTRMTNPLKGATNLDGFTVSLWVYRMDANDNYNALWSFFNSTVASAAGERLFFTGNSYLGYNDNNGTWFDVNHPETKVVDRINAGAWRQITVTFSKDNGYMFYRDGVKYTSTNMKYTGSVEQSEFDWSKVIDFVTSAAYFNLGLGSFWGSAEAKFDDLIIYNRELSADDVKSLYTELTRVNPFDAGTITGVEDIVVEEPTSQTVQGIYDLMGRRVEVPSKGIYIVNGKKVLFK